MNIYASLSPHTYHNITETLVAKEVERQLAALPPTLTHYINPIQVATYALNRLPALYAASTEGLEHQQKRAQKQLSAQILIAVRRGIAAVQRDPLKRSTPLDADTLIEPQMILSDLETWQWSA